MGFFSILTAPLRFGAHIVTGGISRAATRAGASVSANVAMNGVRLQLRSYEAKELFDSKRLDKHFRLFHKVKKRMMRYEAEEEHGTRISPHVKKIYRKYQNDPRLLNKVLLHEVDIFAGYYVQFLKVVTAIQLEESDLILQKNASTIRDEKKMGALVQKIPEMAKRRNVAVIQEDFKKFLTELEAVAKHEAREDRIEFKERRRLEKGAKKPVRGLRGFFGGLTGVHHLAHKVHKISKRLKTHEIRRFDQEFTLLQQEINSGSITPVTISRLTFLLKNYKRIRKYYAEIDADMVLITRKLFDGFEDILNKCVIPFYAAVKNLEGAKVILKITEELKQAYKGSIKETEKEEFEIKRVHQELIRFIRTCEQALEKVQSTNQTVITNLQQQMGIAT
jgi:hypothetical protein